MNRSVTQYFKPNNKFRSDKKSQDEIENLVYKTLGPDVGKDQLNLLMKNCSETFNKTSEFDRQKTRVYLKDFDPVPKLIGKDRVFCLSAVITDGEYIKPVAIYYYVDKNSNPT